MKNEILQLLRSATPAYHSGTELAAELGVSRMAVWKHVRKLMQEGYRIEAVPSKGYRLLSSPDRIRKDAVELNLTTTTIGRTLVYLDETGSTNTVAMEMAQGGAAEGTTVVAERQTGGRGRLGRTWISPPGNLYLSTILRPAIATHLAPRITLMGAVAVAEALREATGVPAGIKWPNDILVRGRKISGLLTELSAEPDRIRHIVIGIGVNVNMDLNKLDPEVKAGATTLSAETGAPIDRTVLLRTILTKLDDWYERVQRDATAILAAWRERNITLGRHLSVRGSGGTIEGLATDIDTEGRLVLQTTDGLRMVASGDVTILKQGETQSGIEDRMQ